MSKRHSSTTLKDLLPIILAIIGVSGTIATAYFAFRSQIAPKELEISATQTAEFLLLKNKTVTPTESSFPITATASPTSTIVSVTNSPTVTPIELTPSGNSYTIAISEVMANPCGIQDSGGDMYWNEYVELYNYGDSPVDVNGWWISDGENLIGNPDMIISWESRFPGITFGNHLETKSTVIPPSGIAVILSPKYLSGDSKYPDFLKPYIFPENTIILTIASSNLLGSDDFGIEIARIRNPVILYQGTDSEIFRLISTYGSPTVTGSPVNASDDEKDGIPLVLNECYAAERIFIDGADVEFNWRAIENGNPGIVPPNP